MKTKLTALACAALLAALVATSQSTAQEPAPDLGESSLLLLACDYIGAVAEREGLTVKACRRDAPELIEGYKATVKVLLITDAGRFHVALEFRRSLWWLEHWDVT